MAINSTSIETVSGSYVDFADPQPDTIFIDDIAWGLSREARFGGHTNTPNPYSVAQHSSVVFNLIVKAFEEGPIQDSLLDYLKDSGIGSTCFHIASLDPDGRRLAALHGLLHDASEAYLRDIPNPAKQLPELKTGYMILEGRLMNVILRKFMGDEFIADKNLSTGLVHVTSPIVGWADRYALTVEAYHMLPSRGQHWTGTLKLPCDALQNFVWPMHSTFANDEFMENFKWAMCLADWKK
jgi:hypothetical protein